MNEKGVSPPPRVEAELYREVEELQLLSDYIRFLDKWLQVLTNSFPKVQTYSVTMDVTNVGANTTSEQTVTVTGLETTDIVYVNKPSHSSGLGVVNARVSAANTLAITFQNTTGAGIDPGSETYLVVAIRR